MINDKWWISTETRNMWDEERRKKNDDWMLEDRSWPMRVKMDIWMWKENCQNGNDEWWMLNNTYDSANKKRPMNDKSGTISN
jgi:hypothetical protein